MGENVKVAWEKLAALSVTILLACIYSSAYTQAHN
jgi:hypothetical protein